MLVLTLIVWQALGFPEVEDPIPDRIGFGSIVGLAGFSGMLAGVLSVIKHPSSRERFVAIGTFVGLCIGIALYVASLAVQLVFDS
jgi:hypothetical protein